MLVQPKVLLLRDGSTKHVSKEDFNKHKYYVSCVKNLVSVKDLRDNTSKKVTKEEFEQTNHYVAFSKNYVSVKDIRDNTTKRVTKEEFENCKYYVSPTSKRVSIYKSDGTLFDECYGNFKKFCKKHNLSYDTLVASYKNDGQPIFTDITERSLNRLKKNLRDFQIGWYAKITV